VFKFNLVVVTSHKLEYIDASLRAIRWHYRTVWSWSTRAETCRTG